MEGIGPKTVKTLWEKLKIKNLDELEAAARAGGLRALPGLWGACARLLAAERFHESHLSTQEGKKTGSPLFILAGFPLAHHHLLGGPVGSGRQRADSGMTVHPRARRARRRPKARKARGRAGDGSTSGEGHGRSTG